MKLRHLSKVALVLGSAFCTLPPPLSAQVDTAPPVLTGLTFSPMAVNTTSSSATVTVTAQVTDDLSGVQQVNVDFVSPSGSQAVQANLNLSSGSNLNGTWTGIATVPAYSEPGTWTAGPVYSWDTVLNGRDYSTAQLQALGFPTQLSVTTNPDTAPPVLTGLTFSPMAVDTTSSSATVTVTAQVTDDLSGVQQVNVDFVSPSGSQAVQANLNLSSGSNLNGTWIGITTLPAHGGHRPSLIIGQ